MGALLSHRKQSPWNVSSVVLPLIPWLVDISLRHHVTHLHNLGPISTVEVYPNTLNSSTSALFHGITTLLHRNTPWCLWAKSFKYCICLTDAFIYFFLINHDTGLTRWKYNKTKWLLCNIWCIQAFRNILTVPFSVITEKATVIVKLFDHLVVTERSSLQLLHDVDLTTLQCLLPHPPPPPFFF